TTAETLLLEAVEYDTQVVGNDHPDTLTCSKNTAERFQQQTFCHIMEQGFLYVIERERRVLGEYHPNLLTTMNNLALAHVYDYQGRHGQAERIMRNALARITAQLGEDHPTTLTKQSIYTRFLQMQNKQAEAESLFADFIVRSRRVFGQRK
ncbi:hypothetical protein BJ742DRAFT_678629, partial [Cladochytrium replicatum]